MSFCTLRFEIADHVEVMAMLEEAIAAGNEDIIEGVERVILDTDDRETALAIETWLEAAEAGA